MNPVRQCCPLAIVIGTGLLYAQPVLERMEPRGVRAGSSVRLVLTGKGLGPDSRLVTDAPFVATPLAGPSTGDQMPFGRLQYLLEADGEAAKPGIYPLRVETPEGLSNMVLFTVGEFPQVMETEPSANDSPATAQAITPPVVVEGRLLGPERDIFRVPARKGQRLVAEIAARRIGSAIDPHLELLDDRGRVVARNADSPGLGLDSRLVFEAETDGDYFIALRDERFSSQQENFYRLTVGDFEFADHVFPLGWTRNAQVDVEFFGGNLGRTLQTTVNLSSVSSTATEMWLPVPGRPSPVPFLLSDSTETLESAANGNLEDGIVVNGRIECPGETDIYKIAARGGEQWSFELRSGELAGSSLYGVMTISSGRDILAVAGKHAGDPNPYVITSTGVTASTPFVKLTVPPDISELNVSVEDLLARGGPEYTYRLVARRQGPDFLLTLNEPYLNIPRNGSAVVTVTVERRGYFGPIQLYLERVPDGVEVSGGHIAPSSTLGNTRPRFATGRLTLTATAEARPRLVDLTVRGKSTGKEGVDLDRRASGPGLKVAVKGTKQPSVTAGWLGYDLPARINPEQPAHIGFVTPHQLRLVRGGKELVAKWKYTARRPGVRITAPVEIPRNTGSIRLRRVDDGKSAESGEFRIFVHERTALGMVNFHLTSTVSASGRDWMLVSKPLEIEVVDGYGLAGAEPGFGIDTGSEAIWRGSIWRDREFQRTVTITVVGLPPAVVCEEARLGGNDTDFELRCTAAGNAPTGEHDVEIRAESVLSDEGTTKYLADPITTTLSIRR